MSSTTLQDRLFEAGLIRARRGPVFDTVPAALPPGFEFDRVEGMLLGLAIGDSLGRTSESCTPADRRRMFGEIKDYVGPVLPTDDTQLAAWAMEHLLERKGQLDPGALGALFASRHIRGIGQSVTGFLRAREAGMPWERCGPRSAGNGALMRIAPVLLPHLRHPSPALWADAALAGMVTHNDPASIASCVGFVAVLWSLLHLDAPPPTGWVAQTWLGAAREVDDGSLYTPRGGIFAGATTFTAHVERCLAWARARNATALEGCDAWHSGAYLLETMPSVLWILERHIADPEEAIIRAVNDTWDNDTVGAIVGAAVGALHGRDGLPSRWVTELPGATTYHGDDPGRLQELIRRGRTEFWG